MRYSELRRILAKHEIDQVGRVTHDGDSIIMIGRPRDICYPFQFDYHSLYAPGDAEDFDLHKEEVLAVLRRFGLSEAEFFPT